MAEAEHRVAAWESEDNKLDDNDSGHSSSEHTHSDDHSADDSSPRRRDIIRDRADRADRATPHRSIRSSSHSHRKSSHSHHKPSRSSRKYHKSSSRASRATRWSQSRVFRESLTSSGSEDSGSVNTMSDASKVTEKIQAMLATARE